MGTNRAPCAVRASADIDIIVLVFVLPAAESLRASIGHRQAAGQPNASAHKSPINQGISRDLVSVVTEDRRSRNAGTRAARCAFAMMNVTTILLLDEEDLMREATALLLANRGARVTKSATLDDALAQLERRTYQVVIVDVHPASPSPTHVLEQITHKVGSDTRVVVCSEKPVPNVDPSCISHQLVKPYPFDRLVEAVFATRSSTVRPVVKPSNRRVTTHRRGAVLRRGRA